MKRVRVLIEGNVEHEVDVDREMVIGRSADVDIRIPDGEVSSRHAKLQPRGDDLFIMDLGSTNGTVLDSGDPITPNEAVKIGRGAKVLIGPAVLEVVEAREEGDDEDESGGHGATVAVGGGERQSMLVNIARFKAAQPRLVVAAAHAHEVLPIEDMEVTVGREATHSDLVVHHDSVSSRHATITFTNGKFMLKDLGSSNGTFLDGNPVSAPTPLPLECAVTFGTVECLFVQRAPDAGSGTGEDPHAEALANHAVRLGKATAQQAKEALAEHRSSGRSLGEILVHKGVLTAADWSEMWRQRQIIGTLGQSAGGGGRSPAMTIIFVVIALAVAAAAMAAAGVFG